MHGRQVINRAKLQRAGKDNLFVRLLYGKDRPRIPATLEEQERIGRVAPPYLLQPCTRPSFRGFFPLHRTGCGAALHGVWRQVPQNVSSIC
jgi:hypothetical protein